MQEPIDIGILKYLDFDNGFYIECGANDGIRQSNTYRLEKEQNWRGILVEPSMFAYERCVENRNNDNIILNVALVSDEYNGDKIYGDFDGDLMSSVQGLRRRNNRMFESKAVTLTSILDEYNVENVDFFSLDVEGYELNVLKGLDFNKYNPTYILIEIYEKDKQEIFDFMNSKDYDFVCNLSGFNRVDNPMWDGTHNDYLFKKK